MLSFYRLSARYCGTSLERIASASSLLMPLIKTFFCFDVKCPSSPNPQPQHSRRCHTLAIIIVVGLTTLTIFYTKNKNHKNLHTLSTAHCHNSRVEPFHAKKRPERRLLARSSPTHVPKSRRTLHVGTRDLTLFSVYDYSLIIIVAFGISCRRHRIRL